MTSKLGLPEASSITAFCRCCCSGICSDSTLMPVSSTNSLMYFCRLSPRGPLARFTSSVVPAYFFHWISANAGTPARANALAAAEPARSERRVINCFFIVVSLPRVVFCLARILTSARGLHSPIVRYSHADVGCCEFDQRAGLKSNLNNVLSVQLKIVCDLLRERLHPGRD